MLKSGINNSINFAFTLAEVLITLAIIGVVAAMTIPVLIQGTQKQEYVTSLKKAYTNFNQVLLLLAQDYGCTGDLQCTGIFSSTKTDDDLGAALVPYFKVAKACTSSPYVSDCFSKNMSNYYDGSSSRYSGDFQYRFITTDGVAYRMTNYATDCAMDTNLGTTGYMTQVCAKVQIDVNGPNKGPNNFGRDILKFYITNGKGPYLYPSGGADFKYYWADNIPDDCGYKNKVYKNGDYCAARVIDEGWQMNY